MTLRKEKKRKEKKREDRYWSKRRKREGDVTHRGEQPERIILLSSLLKGGVLRVQHGLRCIDSPHEDTERGQIVKHAKQIGVR